MNIKCSCPICSKDFEVSKRYYNNSIKGGWKIYCSKECMILSKTKVVHCKCSNCNKDIIKRPSQILKSKTGNIYCSKSCSNSKNNTIFKSGENHPNYTTGYGSYRNRKLKISEEKCEICGINDKRVLEVHHIDNNRKNNNLNNLKLLCANCHKIEHYNESVV